jgi:hypothetical protein
MPTPPVPDHVLRVTYETWVECEKVVTLAAEKLGIDERSVRGRLKKAASRLGLDIDTTDAKFPNYYKRIEKKRKEFEAAPPPDGDVPVEQLVAHMKKRFEKKKAHEEARKLIPVAVKLDGPIGILHFGDPHVDDDGTDIGLLERHKKLCIDTDGLFAANVGDISNNWIGRLARLYADQATSAPQAWRLVEWFLKDLKLLYLIGGNHDGWSGAGDPIKWIARQSGSIYQSSECRMALNFPGGRQVRVNARHDFAGTSQWNPAHGPMKAIFHGVRDHIAICGHKHKSGYGIIKDPDTGIACHAFQVASYKIFDRYARDRGFRDQSLGPCVLTVIDPALPDAHPDLVKPFWDAEEGAAFLNWKRRKFK